MRTALVIAFALVEVDRLVGSFARLTGSHRTFLHRPPNASPWVTALDALGAATACAALLFAYAHFRGAPWSRPFGTIVTTAAAVHTGVLLGALALGRGLGVDPVVLTSFVGTSLPILALALLHWWDDLSRHSTHSP